MSLPSGWNTGKGASDAIAAGAKSGYMYKRAIISGRNWKRRFFALSADWAQLRYYEHQSEPLPARSRGACGAHGRCECRPGWRGDACERPTCGAAEDVLECSGWGKCERGTADDALVAGGGAHCVCAAPRRGARCEEVACPGDCSGRGVCVQPPNAGAGSCVCEPGWEGADCGSRVGGGGCGGNGRCGDDGGCVCRAGWGGAHCTEAVCPGAGWPLNCAAAACDASMRSFDGFDSASGPPLAMRTG